MESNKNNQKEDKSKNDLTDSNLGKLAKSIFELYKKEVSSGAKNGLFFTDSPDSTDTIPLFSLKINILDGEVKKLDSKIYTGLEKLDTKIDNSSDVIKKEFRFLFGGLFALFLVLAGWCFFIISSLSK